MSWTAESRTVATDHFLITTSQSALRTREHRILKQQHCWQTQCKSSSTFSCRCCLIQTEKNGSASDHLQTTTTPPFNDLRKTACHCSKFTVTMSTTPTCRLFLGRLFAANTEAVCCTSVQSLAQARFISTKTTVLAANPLWALICAEVSAQYWNTMLSTMWARCRADSVAHLSFTCLQNKLKSTTIVFYCEITPVVIATRCKAYKAHRWHNNVNAHNISWCCQYWGCW